MAGPSTNQGSPAFAPAGNPRRQSLAWLLVNGALWAVGNGLTTGTLIIYLVLDLGAQGVAISWILAIPAAVGLLRLVSPLLIHLCGTAKATCLWFSLVSYVLLLGLPLMTVPGVLPRAHLLASAVALLCVHQLLEYIATVAFWSWAADLVPRRVRGRFFARRQIWQLAVLIPTLLASGWFVDRWKFWHPAPRAATATLAATPGSPWRLAGYGITSAAGAACLLASLAPLLFIPATRRAPAQAKLALQAIVAPFADRRYLALLAFGSWFSLANGLTQSAQNIYPFAIGLGLLAMSTMQTSMRLGQLGTSRWAGPFSDRYGNRPVLILCQLLVATGPLFYLLASKEQPWWLLGAWLVWSAYAGLNICLPNLMLKLAPLGDRAGANAGYIAAYFAVTNLVYAASTVAGGYLFDYFRDHPPLVFGHYRLTHFDLFFWLAWILRSTAVLWLLLLVEPGAYAWRQILRRPQWGSRVK